MVPKLRELTYEDRLKEMRLPTLQDRREKRSEKLNNAFQLEKTYKLKFSNTDVH